MTNGAAAHADWLRRRLADEFAATGDLRMAAWRQAVEAVPREAFLGDQIYRRVDGQPATLWEPVSPASVGMAAWLDLVYRNETWVTQLDGRDRTPTGPVQGAPTSSSTLPGLVVRMLEDLDADAGMRVLEIGTGTGYSTALLCHRLGADLVTSVEVDPSIAARARGALARVGYYPGLVVGDGLDGYADRAPYDRLIATCSVRSVPPAWLEQTQPGGRILTTLSGWLYGSGLVALQLQEKGCASGRFLPGTVSFMPARAHTPPPLGTLPRREGHTRATETGPDILDDWTVRFLAQLALPTAQHVQVLPDKPGTSPEHLLVDVTTDAYAWLTSHGGEWTVTQGGPVRLWDHLEQTMTEWRRLGAPAQDKFTLIATADTQTVQVETDTGALRWQLPGQ